MDLVQWNISGGMTWMCERWFQFDIEQPYLAVYGLAQVSALGLDDAFHAGYAGAYSALLHLGARDFRDSNSDQVPACR